MHHFVADDFVGSLAAGCLFPMFVLVPGYAVGCSICSDSAGGRSHFALR
jgi:hypothetical protein